MGQSQARKPQRQDTELYGRQTYGRGSEPPIYVLPYTPPPPPPYLGYQQAFHVKHFNDGQIFQSRQSTQEQYMSLRQPSEEQLQQSGHPSEQPLQQSGQLSGQQQQSGQSSEERLPRPGQPSQEQCMPLSQSNQNQIKESKQSSQEQPLRQPSQEQPLRQPSEKQQLRQPSEKQQLRQSSEKQQSRQSSQQQLTQSGQSSQQQPTQSGQPDQQQYMQPSSYQWHSSQPPPNVLYVHQYPMQPPSAQGGPMVREGSWRGSGTRDEPQLEGWEGFRDTKVRRMFVRKVYTILMLQLLCSLAFISLFVFEHNVKRFVHKHIYLFYVALVVFAAVYIGMACSESARRSFPTNVVVLSVFTVAASFMLGTISSVYNTDAVFMAVGVCAAVCLAVSIFSFYTKFDFTTCGGILCILLLILIGFGFIAIFIPSKVMTMIYAGTGAVVFTMILAYNTQMLMGGKRYELSPEEYIFAAVQLYVDIINIFLFILMLFGYQE